MELLRRAGAAGAALHPHALLKDQVGSEGLRVHHLGGVALKNPDLKWLLEKGYIRTIRVPYKENGANDVSKPAMLRLTYAVATDAGRTAYKWGRL